MQDISNKDGANSDPAESIQLLVARTQALSVLMIFVVGLTCLIGIDRFMQKSSHQSFPEHFIVDLNSATVSELNLLPGVGPALAEEIIRFRDLNGGFGSIEDLKRIRGIKDGRLLTLRNHISVGSRTERSTVR